MSQYDQFILLAVLGGVAGLMVLIARQSRERTVIALPAKVEHAPAPTAPAPVAHVAPPEPPVKRKRAKAAPADAPAPVDTPIDAVLTMLCDKDALAKAFLLREILDPPVSRRK